MLCHLGFPLVPDGLIKSNLLVLDETALLEVLLAVLLLLGLEVGGVGGVAPLRVAMVALDVLVILSLFNHHDLVDTTLAGGGNGTDVESDVVTLTLAVVSSEPLPGEPGLEVVSVVDVVSVVVLVVAVVGVAAAVVLGRDRAEVA